MAGGPALPETARIAEETAVMPHDPSPELALVAIDAVPSSRHRVAPEHAGTPGPGWFDSSWELRRGLEVREDWLGDDCLHGWIERFLSSQRVATSRTTSPSSSTAIA